MSDGFGKAKFGGNSRNWYKLKDGVNGPYRIIGPIGDLADDGKWSVYYKIHYGYKNSEGKMRTFESPEVRNHKTKMIDVKDAALQRINDLKTKLDQAQKAGNAELVEQLLKLVGGRKSRFNLDANHYLNVFDLQGNIGILKIRHRAYLALKAKIDELRSQGVEPLDPTTGRYFTFLRSGNGNETIYQVGVYKQKLQIEGVGEVEKDIVHNLLSDKNRIFTRNEDGSFNYKEAARLDRLFKKPTAAEVERIVNEGERAVDEIFDTKAGVEQVEDVGMEDDEAPTPVATATPVVAAPVVTAVPVTFTTEQLAPKPPVTATVTQAAPEAPKATPKVTPVAAPTTTAQAVSSMSDEEFLSKLGL